MIFVSSVVFEKSLLGGATRCGHSTSMPCLGSLLSLLMLICAYSENASSVGVDAKSATSTHRSDASFATVASASSTMTVRHLTRYNLIKTVQKLGSILFLRSIVRLVFTVYPKDSRALLRGNHPWHLGKDAAHCILRDKATTCDRSVLYLAY